VPANNDVAGAGLDVGPARVALNTSIAPFETAGTAAQARSELIAAAGTPDLLRIGTLGSSQDDVSATPFTTNRSRPRGEIRLGARGRGPVLQSLPWITSG
jgi:hypothetical protein